MNGLRLIVEFLFDIGLLINAGLFLPQALKVFSLKDSGSLSLITYLGFNMIQMLLFIHGYYHHDFKLALGMYASFITCSAVTVGIMLYRHPKDDKDAPRD